MPRRKKGSADRIVPHATALTVAARVDDFVRIILDGAQMWDLREFVREKEQEKGSNWALPQGAAPMSDANIWEYKARAEKVVREARNKDRAELIADGLMKRLHLFGKAVCAGDLRTALSCIKDHDELLGLYPDPKAPPPPREPNRRPHDDDADDTVLEPRASEAAADGAA